MEYLSSGGIAVTAEPGVVDWRPRNTTVTGVATAKEPNLVGLETGSLRQLVLAFAQATPPTNTERRVVQLRSQVDATRVYRQYIFRKEGAFTTLAGVEEGLEKKSLRFTAYGSNRDQVEVYINGVKKEQGTAPGEYRLYDGTTSSPVPPNTVLFNTPIDSSSSTQIDVIVSKEAAVTNVSLTFKRNLHDESRAGKGAYENVDHVLKFEDGSWRKYYLFTLDLSDSNIPLNSILQPVPQDGFLMLARAPYSHLDRYADTVVMLRGWSDTDFIKYYTEDNVGTARVTDTAITSFYPPMKMIKFSVEKTIRTPIAGVDEQFVVDGKVITGPNS